MTGFVCVGCGKKCLTPFYRLQEGNFHQECFRCSVCDIGLKSRAYFIQEGKLFCRNDFKCEYDCVCGACNKEIIGERIVALNENFHKTCFHCSKCGSNFKAHCEVSRIGDHFYCTDCSPSSKKEKRYHAVKIGKKFGLARRPSGKLRKCGRNPNIPVPEAFSEELRERLAIQFKVVEQHLASGTWSGCKMKAADPMEAKSMNMAATPAPLSTHKTQTVKTKPVVKMGNSEIKICGGFKPEVAVTSNHAQITAKNTAEKLSNKPQGLLGGSQQKTQLSRGITELSIQPEPNAKAPSPVRTHIPIPMSPASRVGQRPRVITLVKVYEDMFGGKWQSPKAIAQTISNEDCDLNTQSMIPVITDNVGHNSEPRPPPSVEISEVPPDTKLEKDGNQSEEPVPPENTNQRIPPASPLKPPKPQTTEVIVQPKSLHQQRLKRPRATSTPSLEVTSSDFILGSLEKIQQDNETSTEQVMESVKIGRRLSMPPLKVKAKVKPKSQHHSHRRHCGHRKRALSTPSTSVEMNTISATTLRTIDKQLFIAFPANLVSLPHDGERHKAIEVSCNTSPVEPRRFRDAINQADMGLGDESKLPQQQKPQLQPTGRGSLRLISAAAICALILLLVDALIENNRPNLNPQESLGLESIGINSDRGAFYDQWIEMANKILYLHED